MLQEPFVSSAASSSCPEHSLDDHSFHGYSSSGRSSVFSSSSAGLRRRLTYTEAAIETVHKLLTLDTYAKPLREQFTRRSLIGLFLYLLIGLGYYHGHQRLSILDSIYFSITTLITVGYGDIRPGSTNERIFTALYVIFGIFLLSAAVASISATIYAQYNEMVEERFARMALRMHDEKTRLSAVDMDNDMVADLEAALALTNNNDHEHEQRTQNVLNFLDIVPSNSNPQNASSSSFRQRAMSGVEGITSNKGALPLSSSGAATTAQQQQQLDQKILDSLQAVNIKMFDEDLQDMRRNILQTFGLIVILLCTGWLSMLLIEDWNTGDAFYWSVVTITTVGFGDIVPTSAAGKVFTMAYGLVGCAVLASGLNTLVAYPLTRKSKQSELRVMLQFGGQLSEDSLEKILSNDLFERMPNLRSDAESVSRSEFILLVLSMMNKAYDKDLLFISSIFDVLDKQRVGSLSAQTLLQQQQQQQLHHGHDVMI